MREIHLEGVRVHNLKSIDLAVPLQQWVTITGVSGSGKSSLAFDTIYVEGRRRYFDTLSPKARRFLDQLPPPDADRIEPIPPTIAIRQRRAVSSPKGLVATATDIHYGLRVLFSRIGQLICPTCQIAVRSDSPEDSIALLQEIPNGSRYQITFPAVLRTDSQTQNFAEELSRQGFTRTIVNGRTRRLGDSQETIGSDRDQTIWVVVDRLVAGRDDDSRIRESLETAALHGQGRWQLLIEADGSSNEVAQSTTSSTIDEREFFVAEFSNRLECRKCSRIFAEPQPRSFHLNVPSSVCDTCQGQGTLATFELDRVIENPTKSLREGAIGPWNDPRYQSEFDQFIEVAELQNIPVDIPFEKLDDSHHRLIQSGAPGEEFGGLDGFFDSLQSQNKRPAVRTFLNKWQSEIPCPTCRGNRLRGDALAVRILDKNISEVLRMSVAEALTFFKRLTKELEENTRQAAQALIPEIHAQLQFLRDAGLDYLSLDRTIGSLSGGECQRVALTNALSSKLVNTLYVLDEPSAGLHAADNARLIKVLHQLRSSGNSLLIVEHDEAFICESDHVIDVGPGAGKHGGQIVFEGPPATLPQCIESLTGRFLAQNQTANVERATSGEIAGALLQLSGARQNNLKNLTVEFPLNALCVVAGVSGSGKSTLLEDCLFPAACRSLELECDRFLPPDCKIDVGSDQIDDVILVDHNVGGRSSRSNAATYLNIYSDIRKSFATTSEAKRRGFTARDFSFNSSGRGQCPKCRGTGTIDIDMQFLADLSVTCPECHGSRFQRQVLNVKYRGLSIAEVLELTVEDAFAFFRNQSIIQKRLNALKQVGLDYLPLGQPTTTLSGGESQRLRLASFLASGTRARTLFLIDEPTTGLHPADVNRLIQCFDSLLSAGHSLVVVEHNLDIIRNADYIVELGPGAGDSGGKIIATGRPEEIAMDPGSVTGPYLQIGIDRNKTGKM